MNELENLAGARVQTFVPRGEANPGSSSAALQELLAAAARFYQAVQREHRGARPEDHAALCTLVEKAGAQLAIAVSLHPIATVEAGIVHAGRFAPFFKWNEPTAEKHSH